MIFNYTPHDVNIILNNGNKIVLTSSGVARCSQSTEIIGAIDNIPLSVTKFGKVEGLPEPADNIYYIVSRLVRQAEPARHDLLVPNEIVRDDNGNIIGVKSLTKSLSNN